MNWIDVKKRMPKIDKPVLIAIIDGSEYDVEYAFYEGKDRGFSDIYSNGYEDPTHWMKLPRPPKKV